MRSVKSKKNKSTELALIKFFKTNNIISWRRNYKLFGSPDFVFPKHRYAIFTDGCFWHGHNCRNLTPSNNKNYWQKKIAKNKQRDSLVNSELKKKGWTVIRIWECQLKNQEKLNKIFEPLSKSAV